MEHNYRVSGTHRICSLSATQTALNRARGLSVVELLTLIAIIAILASIAAPNYMTAHTRSSVSRANADLRAISVALGAYHVETNKYPWCARYDSAFAFGSRSDFQDTRVATLERLTTPISYLSSSQSFLDPFNPNGQYEGVTETTLEDLPIGANGKPVTYYRYTARNKVDTSGWYQTQIHDVDPSWWFLQSAGPDQKFFWTFQMLNTQATDTPLNRSNCSRLIYNPTNGTTSYGSIWRFGGDPSGCSGSSFYYVAAKVKY